DADLGSSFWSGQLPGEGIAFAHRSIYGIAEPKRHVFWVQHRLGGWEREHSKNQCNRERVSAEQYLLFPGVRSGRSGQTERPVEHRKRQHDILRTDHYRSDVYHDPLTGKSICKRPALDKR